MSEFLSTVAFSIAEAAQRACINMTLGGSENTAASYDVNFTGFLAAGEAMPLAATAAAFGGISLFLFLKGFDGADAAQEDTPSPSKTAG